MLVVAADVIAVGFTQQDREVALRVDAKVETVAAPVEQMAIAFEPATAPAALIVSWDKTKVSVPVSKK